MVGSLHHSARGTTSWSGSHEARRLLAVQPSPSYSCLNHCPDPPSLVLPPVYDVLPRVLASRTLHIHIPAPTSPTSPAYPCPAPSGPELAAPCVIPFDHAETWLTPAVAAAARESRWRHARTLICLFAAACVPPLAMPMRADPAQYLAVLVSHADVAVCARHRRLLRLQV